MSDVREEDLTQMQALCMEVLSARYRLGETLWTMDSRNKKALEKLEEYKLVITMHGVVQGTIRAGLTEAGKKMFVPEGYVPPVFEEFRRELKKAKKRSKRGW